MRRGESEAVHNLILIALTAGLAAAGAHVVRAMDRRAIARPRPGDATVTAVSAAADWPSEGQATVSVAIWNPGSLPVLVGVLLRRRLLPAGRSRTSVARRTSGRRYQPSRQAAVAAVPAGEAGQLSVLVPDGRARRRYRLVLMIGQPDGRLSVISTPVCIGCSSGSAGLRANLI
jgi:hypothetical protein